MVSNFDNIAAGPAPCRASGSTEKRKKWRKRTPRQGALEGFKEFGTQLREGPLQNLPRILGSEPDPQPGPVPGGGDSPQEGHSACPSVHGPHRIRLCTAAQGLLELRGHPASFWRAPTPCKHSATCSSMPGSCFWRTILSVWIPF